MRNLLFLSIFLLVLSYPSTSAYIRISESNIPQSPSLINNSQNPSLIHQETATTSPSTKFYQELSVLSFIGTWKVAGTTASLYKTFDNRQGKIMFNFNEGLKKKNRLVWFEEPDPSDTINRVQILTIDGEYYDNNQVFLFFEAIDQKYVDFSSGIIDLSIPTATIDTLKNCDVSLKIDFHNMLTSESTLNLSGNIIISMRSKTCPLNFDATVYRDQEDTNTKLLGNSIFLGIVFLIIFLTNLKLIYSSFKYHPDCTYLSPYLLVSLAIFDLVYLLNIQTITSFFSFDAPLLIICIVCVLFMFSSILLLATPLMRNTINLKEDITVGEFLKLPLYYGFPPAVMMLAMFISSEHIFVHPVFIFFTNLYPAVQIIEYISEGGPAPFFPKSMICVFSLRILLPLYLKGYSDNLFRVSTSIPLCIAIIAVMIFQILVLYLQAIRGARFFLPDSLFPPENSQYLVKKNKDTEMTRLVTKCELCQKGLLEHPNIERTPNPRVRAALNARRLRSEKIVMTECHHRFHAICLVDRTFSDPFCPICGYELKPIE